MDKESSEKRKSEGRFDGWEDKKGRRGRWPEGEGCCEKCKVSGTVAMTDDGDFCWACLSGMPWLR